MSKTIKLEDQTYNKLEELRSKRETFSQVVERLLVLRDGLVIMRDVIEGNAKYQEFREANNDRAKTPVDSRD